MTKNNDFELENGSNDFFSMISGREYFKQTYDILMDSDKFGKDDLFNFLMNFPNFIPKKGSCKICSNSFKQFRFNGTMVQKLTRKSTGFFEGI